MTAQESDKIFIKGVQYSLFSNPLEDYWTEQNPRPPMKFPSTSCYRGYVATWEIIHDGLYLIDVEFYTPHGTAGIEYVFPLMKGKKIKAVWYTGELRIPLGDCIDYVHRDYDSIYESDWLISIVKGNVISKQYKANY
jgi:hypothetical protein